jgi:hypothetical protein
MAVNAVSSNNGPAPALSIEAKPVVDKPAQAEKTVAAPPPAPVPTVNTSGQTIGTTINTSA